MKVFVIEDRRGFVALPVKLCNYNFSLSFGSRQAATQFPFKSAAQKMIKKYKLENSHVEEFEFDDN